MISRHHLVVPEWGDDLLSRHMNDAHENCVRAFKGSAVRYAKLSRLYDLYIRYQGFAWEPTHLAYFFSRSLSGLLAAVRLALSGQSSEAYACMRVSIENVLYAARVSKDPARACVWDARDASEQTKKDCRKTFVIDPDCINDLRSLQNACSLAEDLKDRYKRCISKGAHPHLGMLDGIVIGPDREDIPILLQNAECCSFLEKTGLAVLKGYRVLISSRKPDTKSSEG